MKEHNEYEFDDRDRITNWLEPLDFSGDGVTTELKRLQKLVKESKTANHFTVRLIKHRKTNQIALARVRTRA